MFVIKRNGRREPVAFDKITERIGRLTYGLAQDHVDPVEIAQKVCIHALVFASFYDITRDLAVMMWSDD